MTTPEIPGSGHLIFDINPKTGAVAFGTNPRMWSNHALKTLVTRLLNDGRLMRLASYGEDGVELYSIQPSDLSKVQNGSAREKKLLVRRTVAAVRDAKCITALVK